MPQAASFLPIVLGAVFALRPLGVAQGLVWCEHDYPRWGGHTPESIVTSAVLGASASIMGSELLQGPLQGLRLFALPRPDAAGYDAGSDAYFSCFWPRCS